MRIADQRQSRQIVLEISISTNSWVQGMHLSSQVTWETENGRITAPGLLGQKVSPISKIATAKRTGSEA
jgi:hypothetical protein